MPAAKLYQTEAALHRACMRVAREYDVRVFKAEEARPGWPDLMIVGTHGRTAFVELKTTAGKLRPAQVRELKWLEEREHTAVVVRTVEDFRFLVSHIGEPLG